MKLIIISYRRCNFLPIFLTLGTYKQLKNVFWLVTVGCIGLLVTNSMLPFPYDLLDITVLSKYALIRIEWKFASLKSECCVRSSQSWGRKVKDV